MFCFPHPTEEWTGLLAQKKNPKVGPSPPLLTPMAELMTLLRVSAE